MSGTYSELQESIAMTSLIRFARAGKARILARCCLSLALCMSVIPQAASADYWLSGSSEEYIPRSCFVGDVVRAVFCSGRYCDNTQLLCAQTNYPSSQLRNRTWQNFISDEGGTADCGRGYITGIAAKGRYGDNITIECSEYRGHSRAVCQWTPYVSEEQGRLDFTANRYATAMQCKGSNCDNKRFLECGYFTP